MIKADKGPHNLPTEFACGCPILTLMRLRLGFTSTRQDLVVLKSGYSGYMIEGSLAGSGFRAYRVQGPGLLEFKAPGKV